MGYERKSTIPGFSPRILTVALSSQSNPSVEYYLYSVESVMGELISNIPLTFRDNCPARSVKLYTQRLGYSPMSCWRCQVAVALTTRKPHLRYKLGNEAYSSGQARQRFFFRMGTASLGCKASQITRKCQQCWGGCTCRCHQGDIG